eukprot:10917008-Lingulodinium_polyedra.AAC.1
MRTRAFPRRPPSHAARTAAAHVHVASNAPWGPEPEWPAQTPGRPQQAHPPRPVPGRGPATPPSRRQTGPLGCSPWRHVDRGAYLGAHATKQATLWLCPCQPLDSPGVQNRCQQA